MPTRRGWKSTTNWLWIEIGILIGLFFLYGCTKVPPNTPPETKLVHADTLVGIHGGYIEVTGEDEESPQSELHFVIEIDGVEMPMDSNRFDLSSLDEGTHRIRIWAVDPQGAKDPSPVELTVRVDLTPPPPPLISARLVASKLDVSVLDYSMEKNDVALLHVTFDSSDTTITYTDGFELNLRKGEGEKTLKVEAIDAAGNPSSPATLEVDTDIDRPPTVFLEHRVFLSLDEPGLELKVEDDWSATPLVTAEVDNEPIEVGPGEVMIPPKFPEGWHTLTVTAVDESGNGSRESRRFYFEKDRPPPPELEIDGDFLRITGYSGGTTAGLYVLGSDGKLRFMRPLKAGESVSMPRGIVFGRSVTIGGMKSVYSAPKVKLPDLNPYIHPALAAVTEDTLISSGSTVRVPGLTVTVPEGKTLVINRGGSLVLERTARVVVRGTLIVEGSLSGGRILIDGGTLLANGASVEDVEMKAISAPVISFSSSNLEGSIVEVGGVQLMIVSETRLDSTTLRISSVGTLHMWHVEANDVALENVGEALIVGSTLGPMSVNTLSKCEISDSTLKGTLSVSGMSELYIRDSRISANEVSTDIASMLVVENSQLDLPKISISRNARCVLRYNDFQRKTTIDLMDADLVFYRQKTDALELRPSGGYRIFEHEP